MTSRTRAVTLLAASALLASCDGSGPTFPRPPVAVTPSPSPSPSPSAEPTPSPSPNLPPRVTVTSGGGCHPSPARPCTVAFNAVVTDPEEDRIAFGWDGCAQGNGPLAICTISAPGVVTATVLVTDGQGNFARASATAEGVNAPPVVAFGHPRPPNPAPSNTLFNLTGGEPTDPEDDDHPNTLCSRATLHTSGPCRAGLGPCGGVGDAFDVDVRTLQGPGTCVVEARVPDVWGAVGVARLVFEVLP
jgi:hypothetical protein